MKANPKTVVLYLGMVGFIVLSFSLITSYGARTLRAPDAVGGQYVIESALIAGCFAQPPLLVVGQSGSYLNADIVASDAKKNVLTRALKGNGALNGQVLSGQLAVAGSVKLGTCPDKKVLAVDAVVSQEGLRGQLKVGSEVSPLTGTRKAEKS